MTMSKKKRRKTKKRKITSELRKCGECTECCVTLHISELNKPKHTKCMHLCGDRPGCNIYVQRPTECMNFQCMWTQRDLPAGSRPDKSGIMAYYVESQFGPTVFITETRPGAFSKNSKTKNEALEVASKKGLAAIVSTYEGAATAMVP